MNRVVSWFSENKRDLPWRAPDASPWSILVSEVMLQQTPVARVLPVHDYWLSRWPTPASLATESLAEVLRAWDKMGYPRRAKRLHEAATVIVNHHQGVVPQELDALLALPGVGDYTARAVRCFAFQIPESVVDTNVRRVVARAVLGQGEAGPPRTVADRGALGELLETLDDDPARCAGAAGLMELGALVCKARTPDCQACPLADVCQWRAQGYPAYVGKIAPKQARFEGSDRQARGVILRELRTSDTPVPEIFLQGLWPEAPQFSRALSSLIEDGLIEVSADDPESYRISGS
jgi:A/G-specific adenine glycosylase